MSIRFLMMSAVAAFTLAWAPLAPAQADSPPRAAQSAGPFSDDELKSFARAAVEIQLINDTWLPKLQTATSPEERQEVQKSASEQMLRAVETKGMTVERFEEILSHARANPQVAERVRQHLTQPK